MTVAGVCPDCGTARPIAEYLSEARARQALHAALKLDPRLADPVLEYLALFAPTGRKLASNKLVRVLTELGELVAAGTVEHKKMTYSAPVDYWRLGLEEMLTARERLTLPLSNHNYLRAVVAGIATKAMGNGEQKREEALRNPARRVGHDGGPVKVAEKIKPSGPPPGWKDQVLKRNHDDA
jgi:hypothetical protein